MTQDLFNNILAVIGAITGLSGLALSLYLLHKEKIEFDVYHPTNEQGSSYAGFNAIYNGTDGCGGAVYSYTPYLLLIWLQITNKSKSHTTILEISLKLPNCKESILYSRTSDKYSIASKYVIDDNGDIDIKSSWHIANTQKPPIYIPSFSTVEGYFYFRDLDIVLEKSTVAILKVKTPQGISKHKIVINPNYPKLIE